MNSPETANLQNTPNFFSSVQVGGEAGLAIRNGRSAKLIEVPWEWATTIAALFEQSCKKNSHERFLGTRKLIKRDFVTASDGRYV